jgi:hypothetical protein
LRCDQHRRRAIGGEPRSLHCILDGDISMAKQPAAPIKHPNLFELSGDGIQVTYSTTGFDGKPHFGYHDAHTTKSFTGNEIRTVKTEIGTFVTVTLNLTVDFGSTSFSVMIPDVNLRFSDSVNIDTFGVTTLHRFSIIGPPNGQIEVYTRHSLHGTASLVPF